MQIVCCRGLCTGARQWHDPSAEPINTTGGISRYCCQMPTHQEGCSSCTPPFSQQVHWIWHICSLTQAQLSVWSPDGHLFGPQGHLRAVTRGGCVSTSVSLTSCPTVQSSGVFLQKPDQRGLKKAPPSPAVSPLLLYRILHSPEFSLLSVRVKIVKKICYLLFCEGNITVDTSAQCWVRKTLR